MSTPVFIVARTYMCAVGVARREGIEDPRAMSWLTHTMMHKILGVEQPTVWITPCGRELLDDSDRATIASRNPVLFAVACEHSMTLQEMT